jgi:hypothetical protein
VDLTCQHKNQTLLVEWPEIMTCPVGTRRPGVNRNWIFRLDGVILLTWENERISPAGQERGPCLAEPPRRG